MRRLMSCVVIGLFCAAVYAAGCGGSGTASSGGIGDATNITGTVYAPSGLTGVAGASVYVPGGVSGNVSKAVTDPADDGTTCDDPPETACASTCTQANGTFTLDVSACVDTATSIKFVKGSFTKTSTLDCGSDTTCTLVATDSTFAATAVSMAVVTGAYDNMEDVLAKLGFGTLDATGHLTIGTEQFSLYRGGGSIDSQLTDTDRYKTATTLFADVDEMKQYSIIFINCGADETLVSTNEAVSPGFTFKAHHKAAHGLKSLPTTVVTNLQTFVQDGGRLYVTDLAYDFIEQPFPAVMDFEGSGTDASTAEDYGAAQLGTSGIVSDATVNDTTMQSWLSAQTSNTITGTGVPSNEDCTTTENGSTTALNSDNTIRIGDFLSGWAVMNSIHSGQDTKTWLTGPVSFSGGSGDRPLTITKTVGSGRVLYSSYHTAHSCPTTGAWPQERVLQYLVFEVAD